MTSNVPFSSLVKSLDFLSLSILFFSFCFVNDYCVLNLRSRNYFSFLT